MLAKFKFKSKKEKNKIKLFRCADVLENTKKLSGSRTEILSNKELSLDGCKQIIEYNDVYVRIKISEGYLTVCGTSLNIPVFDGPQITVTGKIESIEFSVGK